MRNITFLKKTNLKTFLSLERSKRNKNFNYILYINVENLHFSFFIHLVTATKELLRQKVIKTNQHSILLILKDVLYFFVWMFKMMFFYTRIYKSQKLCKFTTLVS